MVDPGQAAITDGDGGRRQHQKPRAWWLSTPQESNLDSIEPPMAWNRHVLNHRSCLLSTL